jgi:hypothetical protein
MRNNTIYKTLLTAIQDACKESDGVPFNTKLVEKLKPKVEPLASFFSITTEESIVLAFLVQSAMRDNDVSMDTLIEHFGKEISGIADVQEIILSLRESGLVYTKARSKRRQRLAFNNVATNPKVIASITEGDISLMDFNSAQTFGDFLKDITDLIYQRINEIIETDKLVSEVNRVIAMNLHIQEVNWIHSQHEIKGVDLVVFLNIAIEHSLGEEEVDIDKILKEVIDDVFQRTIYKQQLKNKERGLFASGHVVPSGEHFSVFNLVQLGEHSMSKIFETVSEVNTKPFSPRMGHFINHDQITTENLCYNSKEKEQISTLTRALHQSNYENIQQKMTGNGMCPGFTVLMYGYPGTGKTSSVKQIAKTTGRHIFMLDIPKINSKWVGESEKNLSRLFDEYRRSRKHFDLDPILLINEADAILGKRISANSSVDKMNNSLQNILLQELEDFEGIFIATTNLAEQLDGAFDRRLLYKLEFKKPEAEVRLEILRNAFPELEDNSLLIINRDYPLTGGQIANIKKKILVKEMLEEDVDVESALLLLCEEEFSLRNNSNRTPIGFVTNGKESRVAIDQ